MTSKVGLRATSRLRLLLVLVAGLIIILTYFPYGIYIAGDNRTDTAYLIKDKADLNADLIEYYLKMTGDISSMIQLVKSTSGGIDNYVQAFDVIKFQSANLLVFIFILLLVTSTRLFRNDRVTAYLYNNSYKICLAVSFIFFMLSITLGEKIFNHVPNIQDSIAQLFHAKAFLAGKFYFTAPEFPEFFYFTHTIVDSGRWYSQYPPGHIALLAVGLLLKAPYIINPLFGALNIIINYKLAKEVFNRRIAFISMLIIAVSPMMVEMSIEYMNSPSSLFFAGLFYLYFFKYVRSPSFQSAAIIGLTVGAVFLIRPYTAIAISLPYAFYLSYLCIKDIRLHLAKLFLSFSCFLICFLLYLYFNYKTNGDPFLAGYIKLWGEGHNPGFGHSGWGEPHTFRLALANLSNDLVALNYYLGGFGYPVLILVAPLIVFFKRNTKKLQSWLLILPCISLAVFNFFYFYQMLIFGPRFFHEALPLLCILIAYSLHLFIKMVPYIKVNLSKNFCRSFLVASILSALICNAVSLIRYAIPQAKANSYALLEENMRKYPVHNSIIFIDSSFQKMANVIPQSEDADVIYARNLSSHNRVLIAKYPDRNVYYELKGELYDRNMVKVQIDNVNNRALN